MTTRYYAIINSQTNRATSLWTFDHDPDPSNKAVVDGFSITKDQYIEWNNNYYTRAWRDNELVAVESNQIWTIPNFIVISRITEANKLREALIALKIDSPVSELSDDELSLRIKWDKSTTFLSSDKSIIDLVSSIGLDPDIILRPAGT